MGCMIFREKERTRRAVFGFLYSAFANRGGDVDKIDIFHVNPEQPEEGILYKLFGRT